MRGIRRTRRGRLRSELAWVFLMGMLVGGVVHAQARAECTALWSAGRALVTVELDRLLDAELLRLIRLGLSGHLRLRLSLVRTHALWFDEGLAEEQAEAVITWSPSEKRYVLDGHRTVDPEKLVTERFVLRPDAAHDPRGTYRIDVHAELQVVTAQSLTQVAEWMGAASADSQVGQRVLRTLESDLTHAVDARCVPRERQ